MSETYEVSNPVGGCGPQPPRWRPVSIGVFEENPGVFRFTTKNVGVDDIATDAVDLLVGGVTSSIGLLSGDRNDEVTRETPSPDIAPGTEPSSSAPGFGAWEARARPPPASPRSAAFLDMAGKTREKKPGPRPERVAVDSDGQKAVATAVEIGKPPGGWPKPKKRGGGGGKRKRTPRKLPRGATRQGRSTDCPSPIGIYPRFSSKTGRTICY